MKLTLEEFEQSYFYKTELVQLCKYYGLPTYGTKAELNQYLKRYLSGTSPDKIKPTRKKSSIKGALNKPITLDTKIIGEHFAFNQEARMLFAQYFGIKKFSFKKEMAAIKRKAECDNNTEMTVRDLLEQYQEQSEGHLSQTDEDLTYQWNNFLKDFCACSQSSHFTPKLKVASILWKKVKNSKEEKMFKVEQLELYKESIAEYKC